MKRNTLISMWVAALRSGGYKQGKTYLKSVNRESGDVEYCCLGVLCEIMGVPQRKSLDPAEYIIFENYSCSQLPEEVVAELGMYGTMGETKLYDGNSLAMANDMGRSFKEIADMIEKNPDNWFRPEKDADIHVQESTNGATIH
jgi:hypothetical protein